MISVSSERNTLFPLCVRARSNRHPCGRRKEGGPGGGRGQVRNPQVFAPKMAHTKFSRAVASMWWKSGQPEEEGPPPPTGPSVPPIGPVLYFAQNRGEHPPNCTVLGKNLCKASPVPAWGAKGQKQPWSAEGQLSHSHPTNTLSPVAWDKPCQQIFSQSPNQCQSTNRPTFLTLAQPPPPRPRPEFYSGDK